MTNRIAALAFIAGIAATLTTAACIAPQEPPTGPTITLEPCAEEDSDNCYWDASERGNGEGTDFITLDGIVYYPSN